MCSGLRVVDALFRPTTGRGISLKSIVPSRCAALFWISSEEAIPRRQRLRGGCSPPPACRSKTVLQPRAPGSCRRNSGCANPSASAFSGFVIRPCATPGDVDVWVSAHHVGVDGVPLQELLSGTRARVGKRHPGFPRGGYRRAVHAAARVFGRRRTCRRRDAVLHGLLAGDGTAASGERQICRRLRAPATFGAILAWVLEAEPEFSDVRIASTVDVAASRGYDRDVDVVPLRPADFAAGPDRWNGLIEFANGSIA